MRDRICDTTPRIRRHMNIFVRGERSDLGDAAGTGRRDGRSDRDERRVMNRGFQ